MTLDFVYGNVQDGRLIPLDGQQRLTTLWLLHWYAAKHEGINDHQLGRFSYNTRYSARDFLAKMVDFDPSFIQPLSKEISNQGWFPMDWRNDPNEEVEDSDFRRRLRIVVNLLKNSRNEVVDNPNGDAGNRMPANLLHVENIILSGEIADNIEIDGERRPNFNVLQMEEERHKLRFTQEQPESAAGLFQLEDHRLIEGRTEIIGYGNTHLYQRFIELFGNCSHDTVDCAMLAIGDYRQRLNTWCVQLGSGNEDTMGNKAWYALFHPSGKNPDFNKTKKSLRTLLEMDIPLDDDHLKGISEAYLEDCRNNNLFDWRYYYITYPTAFRPYRFGKYTMYVDEQPYNMVALHTEHKESSNAYQCMLAALMDESAVADSANWYGIRELTYRRGLLTCENDAFVSCAISDGKERARFLIPQNADGIDIVDRIEYFKENRKNEDLWTYPEL